MLPHASCRLRIARPCRDLAAAERFWVQGLGLDVLERVAPSPEGGHHLLMLGWRDAAWHLEVVADDDPAVAPRPTEEDLLVVYLDGPVEQAVADRLVQAGGTRVAARNACWARWGVRARQTII